MRVWRRTHLGSEADRATFRTLHTASLASPALREGLTTASAERAVRHLRDLLGTPALAVTDTAGCLAWDGDGATTSSQVSAAGGDHRRARAAPRASAAATCRATSPGCAGPDRGGEPAGGRRADRRHPGRRSRRTPPPASPWRPTRSRSGCPASSSWPSSTRRRTRLMEAEVRALRAQISPHFIYNSLNAIAQLRAHRPRPGARRCCWSSPTSPATPSAGTASSRRWPRSSARSSATCCSSRPGSATGCR